MVLVSSQGTVMELGCHCYQYSTTADCCQTQCSKLTTGLRKLWLQKANIQAEITASAQANQGLACAELQALSITAMLA